jgi:DNA-binding NarL/FixJ family response regulator
MRWCDVRLAGGLWGEIATGQVAAAPRRVRETIIARVLIIDDDAAFAEALRAHLDTIAGIEIAGVAHGGTEGVELALARDPDVILVDALMPELDGFEVIRRVRARGSTAKAIVMSGGEPVEISEEALAVRADAYLAKLAIYDLIAGVIDKLAQPEETALPAASRDRLAPARRR